MYGLPCGWCVCACVLLLGKVEMLGGIFWSEFESYLCWSIFLSVPFVSESSKRFVTKLRYNMILDQIHSQKSQYELSLLSNVQTMNTYNCIRSLQYALAF